MLFKSNRHLEKKATNVVFSQEGEDLILNELMAGASSGFYVDIGAFDPWRFSNTAYFYKKGWRGINFDARPGFKQLFDQHRPKDLNIECAVGAKADSVKFFLFDEPALNTTCEKRAAYLQKNTPYQLKNIVYCPSRTLDDLLKNLCQTPIDFMNVDVEGAELDVLLSNNWKKHRPKFLVLEILDTSVTDLGKNPCIKLMKSFGYDLVTKGIRSVILRDKR